MKCLTHSKCSKMSSIISMRSKTLSQATGPLPQPCREDNSEGVVQTLLPEASIHLID